MAKRSLMLTTTEAGTGKKLQKAISDINPQASAEVLKTFTQKLNALTTNTYVQTDAIDKFNVDTEIPTADTRQDPTFETNSDQWLTVPKDRGAASTAGYTTNSDGEISVAVNGTNGVAFWITEELILSAVQISGTPQPGTVTVRITGTENFKPFEKTYDFTIAE